MGVLAPGIYFLTWWWGGTKVGMGDAVGRGGGRRGGERREGETQKLFLEPGSTPPSCCHGYSDVTREGVPPTDPALPPRKFELLGGCGGRGARVESL